MRKQIQGAARKEAELLGGRALKKKRGAVPEHGRALRLAAHPGGTAADAAITRNKRRIRVHYLLTWEGSLVIRSPPRFPFRPTSLLPSEKHRVRTNQPKMPKRH